VLPRHGGIRDHSAVDLKAEARDRDAAVWDAAADCLTPLMRSVLRGLNPHRELLTVAQSDRVLAA
jgi:hypothetical protein